MSDVNPSGPVNDRPVPVPGAGQPPPVFDVDLGARTHPGKLRETNDDHFHVVRFGRYLRTELSSLPPGEVAEEPDRPGYGFVVADGVGGRAAGETASRLAISLLVDCALQTPDWILGHEDDLLSQAMVRSARRFQAVNEAVLKKAESRPGLQGMGTTMSLAMTLGDDLLVTHVGDSRVYLLRQGRLRRLTQDHAAAPPAAHPAGVSAARIRRVLTHAIGIPETGGQPDLHHYKLADGDRLLLCTDGLTDLVRDDKIADELGRAPSAAAACQALVDLALARGGRDNVTAVVAAYRLSNAAASRPAG
jgi:PPM family protein phosphatase